MIWQDQWIIEHFNGKYAELCREYNQTFGTDICRGSFQYHCIKLGLEAERYYTEEMKEWLIRNYPKIGRTKATKEFNEIFHTDKHPKTLEKYCHKLGIRVDEERKVNRYDEFRKPIGHTFRNCRGEWKIKTENGYIPLTHYKREVPKGYVAIHLDRNPDNNEANNIAVVKNGIQTIMINQNMYSENADITRCALVWSELYKLLGNQFAQVSKMVKEGEE